MIPVHYILIIDIEHHFQEEHNQEVLHQPEVHIQLKDIYIISQQRMQLPIKILLNSDRKRTLEAPGEDCAAAGEDVGAAATGLEA